MSFLKRFTFALAMLGVLASAPLQAKYFGADPPLRCNGGCTACQGNAAAGPGGNCSASERCATGSCFSRTEGNQKESYAGPAAKGGSGSLPALTFSYNSYNADTSRARIDTVLGNGWTHSYNVFLYSVRGHLFRVDGEGRITKYKLGPGGSFTAAPGYFETFVRNPDGSYTLRQKDGTVYRFADVGTPFLLGTPVYQLTQITDRNGNALTYTYSAGLLSQVTDPYGRSLSFSYNAQKKLAAVSDALGRSTRFSYDASGAQLQSITDPAGRTTQYSYNFLFQLTRKVDRDGRPYTYGYQNDKPVSLSDGTGNAYFTLSNPGNWATNDTVLAQDMVRQYVPATTTKVDGRGNVWSYGYDANGYVTQMRAPDGATWRYSYDAGTLMPASETDANNRTTSYQYDSRGNLIRRTDALGFVTAYAYEPVFNQVTSMTDANGRVTSYQYDARGNRIQETDALGGTRQWTYDARGNVTSEKDKNGNVTSYQYDAFGQRVKVTDAAGNVTTMTYDAVGNVLTRTNARGFTTSYQYDALDRLTGETDARGKVTQSFYDGEGDRTRVIDRNGNATAYQYDQRRRLVNTIDALNQMTTRSYDGNDNPVNMIDRNNHATSFQYDVQNRLVKVTDALGNSRSTAYDPVGNKLADTDANNHTTIYDYDALNRRIQTADAVGSVTRFEYDTTGPCPGCSGPTRGSSLETRQTDANGKVIYYKYDALDRTIRQIRKQTDTADTEDSDDAVTVYSYDAVGNRLVVKEPNGITMTYTYDALDRKVKQVNAAGDTTTYAYDPVGNLLTTIAPTTNVTTRTCDALDRVVQVGDSAGILATYTYDAVGNQLTVTDGNGSTITNAYDAIYRLTQSIDALGRTASYSYDPAGNLLSRTDRNGNLTQYAYDAINRRVSTTDALGHATLYRYDPVGNLTQLTDANGHSTGYGYDSVNRRVSESFADGFARTYGYDAVGNLTRRTDQNGITTQYLYSDLYFLLKRDYPGNDHDDTLSYDLSGRMLSACRGGPVDDLPADTCAGWLVTFVYDGANRITQTLQNGKAVTYSYDIPGRTRSLTYPGGRTIFESMDIRSRLSAIDDGAPNLVLYTYDPGDRTLTRTYRNGVEASYTYNANNWVVSLDHVLGATRIAGFSHDYDNEGNKRVEQKLPDAANSQAKSEAYGYDNLYRLIDYKVGTLSGSSVALPTTQTQYVLDPVGNWNQKVKDLIPETRAHNAVNEITLIDGAPLAYDRNGNLIEDSLWRYAYDEENRLTAVQRKSDSVTVGQYRYDALSRRIDKLTNPGGTPTETRYFHDDARLIEEQSAAGATLATYVYGGYIDEVLTLQRAAAQYFYHQNTLWSVQAITDAAGSVVERYSYDAYGLPQITTGAGVPVPNNAWGTPHSAIGNPWMFTGRQFDEESGLYFYRARYYDPVKGRFLQRDPLGYANGSNLYEYVTSNPVNFVDPRGLECIVCSAGIRYRVPIAALDASQEDTPYASAARAWEDEWKKKTEELRKFWQFTIPRFDTAGPRDVRNPEFTFGNKAKMPARAFGLALFLFYVDFEVCNPDDCKLILREDRKHEQWKDGKWLDVTEKADQGDKEIAIAPPWSLNLRKSKRKQPLGACTHTIVAADMAGISSIINPPNKGDVEINRISARQTVELQDKGTGRTVSRIVHDFVLGHDKDGNMLVRP